MVVGIGEGSTVEKKKKKTFPRIKASVAGHEDQFFYIHASKEMRVQIWGLE